MAAVPVSAAAMVAGSLLTPPPPRDVVEKFFPDAGTREAAEG